MTELRQLYDEQGEPLVGQGATKQQIFAKGLLHGGAHVWIWRRHGGDSAEVLLQKRASTKLTWPNLYDISAAGHIDVGETPLITAVRETKEEIGLEIAAPDLRFIGVSRIHMTAPYGSIEHELRWIYLLELGNSPEFSPRAEEVDELKWVPLETFKTGVFRDQDDSYVPQGRPYFETVISAIENELVKPGH